MKLLTNQDKDLCTYAGVFGALIAATTLFQHFIITVPAGLTAIMAIFYIISIICFGMLAAQHWLAPYLLIPSTIMVIVSGTILSKHGVFSLIVVLLYIYQIAFVIILFNDHIPQKLRQRALAKLQEEQLWDGKI